MEGRLEIPYARRGHGSLACLHGIGRWFLLTFYSGICNGQPSLAGAMNQSYFIRHSRNASCPSALHATGDGARNARYGPPFRWRPRKTCDMRGA